MSPMRIWAGLMVAALLLTGCSGAGAPERDELELGAVNPSPAEPPSPDELPLETELRFAVIGDFGTGEPDQYAVARRMCKWRERHPFDVVFTTGDNVYPDGERKDFEAKFFRPMDCLLSDGVRFHASLGNHDIATGNGRPQLSEPAFGMPARNYVVRRDGVRFVVANSNDFRMGWLSRALEPRPGDRWTIVLFHHPVYSAGTTHGSTPGLAGKLHGLFREEGVDLVLTGHDHVYSLSEDKDGIRYVVTGGGGARSYGCKESPDIEVCVSRLHFLYIRATNTEIKVKAVADTGAVFDRFVTSGVDLESAN